MTNIRVSAPEFNDLLQFLGVMLPEPARNAMATGGVEINWIALEMLEAGLYDKWGKGLCEDGEFVYYDEILLDWSDRLEEADP